MSDSSMIAFLPANGLWVKQDFPHLTLVYGGPIAGRDKSEFNAMGKDGISAARVTGSFSLNVIGVETLGDPGEEVDALMMHPTAQLLVARQIVQKWDKSGFPNLLPHVSVGPAGSAFAQQVPSDTNDLTYTNRRRDILPSSVYFDRLAICWGDDRLIFNLSSFDY